jgi:hypothetical protein
MQTDVHALSGLRTHDPIVRTKEDISCLRPRGHCGRMLLYRSLVFPRTQIPNQTGSGAHPTSYTVGTGTSFPGVKRPGREADHLPPTSAEVKKMWIYTSTSPYAFMA